MSARVVVSHPPVIPHLHRLPALKLPSRRQAVESHGTPGDQPSNIMSTAFRGMIRGRRTYRVKDNSPRRE